MKRILALILTLCLIFSMVPVNVVSAVGSQDAPQIAPENTDPAPMTLQAPAGHTQHYTCNCAVEGASACAGHGTEAAQPWAEWTETATLPTTTGNYYLTSNIELTNTDAMTIASGQVVNLCLNGFSIKFNAKNTGKANYHVAKGGQLTVINCQAKLDDKGMYVSGNKGDLTDLTAGRLYNGRSYEGGAILNEGTLKLIGVALCENDAQGGSTQGFGGAVRMQNEAVMTVEHCLFDKNIAKRAGAAIDVNAGGGTLTVKKTVFSGNEATGVVTTDKKNLNQGYGGAISLTAGAKAVNVTIHDCKLTGNKAPKGAAVGFWWGSGVAANPNLTISGNTEITGNEAYKPTTFTGSGAARGGALYVHMNSTETTYTPNVTICDQVKITGNHAADNAGAIYLNTSNNSNLPTYITVAGDVQIKDNTAGGVGKNIYLWKDYQKVKVGLLSANAYVGVATSTSLSVDDADDFLLVADNVTLPDMDNARVVYDNKNATVGYSTAPNVKFHFGHAHYACACVLPNSGTSGCTHTEGIEWMPWDDAGKLPDTPGNWYLTKDIVVTSAKQVKLTKDQTLNLCLNGYSIQFHPDIAKSSKQTNYYVDQGAVMNVINCRAKLDGNGMLAYGNQSDPANETAGRLFGGRGQYGGAMYVKGQLTLIGVEFYDNRALNGSDAFGGALRVQQGGKVIIKNSLFEKNAANLYGGAIALWNNAAGLEIQDTAFVDNESLTDNGGALYIENTTAKLKNTLLDQNTAKKDGGAIYTKKATVELGEGVVISNNTAKVNGGAVSTTNNSTLSTSGAKFTGNSAGDGGGAIYCNASALNAEKTDFESNRAGAGGAIWVGNGGTVNVAQTNFMGNTANNGGAIFSNNGDAAITAHDVIFTKNKANGAGGAIFLKSNKDAVATKDITLTVTGNSQFTENESTGSGAAIYVTCDAGKDGTQLKPVQVTLDGDIKITGNSGAGNSGAVAMDSANGEDISYLTVSGNVVINGNTTTKSKPNVSLSTKSLIKVGQLGGDADIHVIPVGTPTDPDAFLVATDTTKVAKKTGITALSSKETVGYDENRKFYYAGVDTQHKEHVVCSCAITGKTGCQHDSNVEWTPWIYSNKLPTTTGNYYLTRNIVITGNAGGTGMFEIQKNQKVNLCLNGYSVTFSEENTDKANYYVMSGAQLTIINCKTVLDKGLYKTGNITNAKGGALTGGRGKYGGALYAKGELTLIGVKLYDNQALTGSNAFGGAIRAQEGAKVVIKNSLFTGNKATLQGGAIAIWRDSTLEVQDTVFTKNASTKDKGGALYIEKTDATFNNVRLEQNTCVNEGGALHIKNATAKLHDVLINQNTAERGGGGAYMNGSTVDIDETVVVSKNTTTRSHGGGLWASCGTVLNMTGGKITGNKAKYNGGGIYVSKLDGKASVLNMSGGEISGNTADAGGGVFHNSTTGNYTGGIITKNSVTSNSGGGGMYLKEGAKVVLENGIVISGNTVPKTGGAIILQRESELIMNGGTIEKNKAATAGAIIMWSKSKMTMNDGAIQNNAAQNGSGGAFYIQGGCTLDIKGGKITGNTAKTYGGALNVVKNDDSPIAINMSGGEISGNKCGKQGGGIYIKDATLNMSGGKITGNASESSGGGICTSKECTINVSGGEISKNTAKGAAGGALIQGKSTLNLSNATIKGNYTKTSGGGVYISTNAKLNMKSGYITGNTAQTTGGGVYESKGEVVISGGVISYNKSEKSHGGGIHASEGKLRIYGGNICYNEAFYRGGGIRTYKYTDFVMTGGRIANNTAEAGGGISLESNATITGSYICDNKCVPRAEKAVTKGGAIYVVNTSDTTGVPVYVLTVSDTEFSGNTVENAESMGGALFFGMECTINATGCTFTDNAAGKNGGAIMAFNQRNQRAKEAYLNVEDCKFTGNQAGLNGGAIFSSWTTESRINNSTFVDNTAGANGGAIYLRKHSSAWIKKSVLMENTAKELGSAIYVGEDAELEDLTITKNHSGDGYALYLPDGEYDGESYVRSLVKIGGAMRVYDNEGEKPDMFIGKDLVVTVNSTGLTDGTRINVELASGVLTNTLLGAYDYEGGNQKYLVTCGDRSLTDIEALPTQNEEPTEIATDHTATILVVAVGAVAVAAIALIAVMIIRKKKKAEAAEQAPAASDER